MVETLTLYRPVGLKETELVLARGCTGFPPRLPDQPLFYPVMNAAYARRIARDWNAPDAGSGLVGFVTAFDVDAAYLARFPVRGLEERARTELITRIRAAWAAMFPAWLLPGQGPRAEGAASG